MKKNLTWTIFKKECARFFGDKVLFFTAVIMPGLLIYIIYTFMGDGLANMTQVDADKPTTVYVENLPSSLRPLFCALPVQLDTTDFVANDIITELSDKEVNKVLVSFPVGFDSLTTSYDSQYDTVAPNVQIYYNSVNNASNAAYINITSILDEYEAAFCNRFDVNRTDNEDQTFNMASESDEIGSVLGSLFPMLLVMLIFSGCMAVAPSAIAGEKERGTIATLLVTPMKRSQLALGKVLSLACFALMSGLSSFLGILFSLPNLLHAGADDINLNISAIYTTGDYALLLLLILSTTLIMTAGISLLSAWAKNVKQAGTMVTPFMLIILFCGLMPMLQGNREIGNALFLVPFYNSIESMAEIFAFEPNPAHMGITIIANLAYTVIAVWGLTKMFNSEKVMFGR